MIAIREEDYELYGCPRCGLFKPFIRDMGIVWALLSCPVCKKEFIVAVGLGIGDRVPFSFMKFLDGKLDGWENPLILHHPQEGIPCHLDQSKAASADRLLLDL